MPNKVGKVYKLKQILFKSHLFKMAISWLTTILLSTSILKASKQVFPTGFCIKQQGCLNTPHITQSYKQATSNNRIQDS